ncbi:MAG: DMT family transporter [Candidatus Saccharibacteria bacterium]|nr:DMT family transporter [Candidatus Saccharibacteria bacterium]
MLWLILCITAALIWSVGAFIDNYITDVIFKGKTPQGMKALNGPFYLIIATIVGIICKIQFPEVSQIVLLLISGALSSVSSLAYYQALKNEEATGAAIFYQLQPVLFLIIDFILFGETISLRQIIGFAVILLAPVLVVFARKRAKSRRMALNAAALLVLYVIIATVSAEIAVRSTSNVDYKAVFVIYLIGRGISDCLLGLIPKFRKRHKYIMKHNKKTYIGVVAINQCLSAAADFIYRYGLVIGVAALGSAVTNAAELILTFILGIILSIIWPNFGREKLHKHLIIAHAVAIVLCVVGIIIIQ